MLLHVRVCVCVCLSVMLMLYLFCHPVHSVWCSGMSWLRYARLWKWSPEPCGHIFFHLEVLKGREQVNRIYDLWPPGKVLELAHADPVTAASVKPREREVADVITSTQCASPHHISWKNKNQSVWLRKRDTERGREKKGKESGCVIDRTRREKEKKKKWDQTTSPWRANVFSTGKYWTA